jgi:hemoglobin
MKKAGEPVTASTHLQRFDMSREDIERLMRVFYARIRAHDVLGPIFIRAVGEDGPVWRTHEAKIASFWRNAIGMERDYQGNPMQVHLGNGEVQPELFPLWLALFHEVAAELLTPDKAANISALADRIGQGLSFGIATARGKAVAPPVLR